MEADKAGSGLATDRSSRNQPPPAWKGIAASCFNVLPWAICFTQVITSLSLVFALTSKGFLDAHKDKSGTPCGCTIGQDQDTMVNWVLLMLAIQAFWICVSRPVTVFILVASRRYCTCCSMESLRNSGAFGGSSPSSKQVGSNEGAGDGIELGAVDLKVKEEGTPVVSSRFGWVGQREGEDSGDSRMNRYTSSKSVGEGMAVMTNPAFQRMGNRMTSGHVG